LDLNALIISPRCAFSFHLYVSNTYVLSLTSPRFKQTSPPFSWIPAALEISLDALLNGTVCPSNPARPRRGLTTRTMSTMSRCSTIKRHPSPHTTIFPTHSNPLHLPELLQNASRRSPGRSMPARLPPPWAPQDDGEERARPRPPFFFPFPSSTLSRPCWS
jgi:hypothetical protein